MTPDRYAPTVLYQDAALRIVQVWTDPYCGHWQGEPFASHEQHPDPEACPDPTRTRSLMIERASDTDALGQPIWLPGSAIKAAELLRLLETITVEQVAQMREAPRASRFALCAECGHARQDHLIEPPRYCVVATLRKQNGKPADMDCSCDGFTEPLKAQP